MAMSMRLQRIGAKKEPRYRIVVIEQSSGADAGYIEKIGNFFPEANNEDEEVDLDEDKAIEWLENGAIPSDTVKDILSREGVTEEMTEGSTSA